MEPVTDPSKLPKVYEPKQYETAMYALWEEHDAFVADPSSKKQKFSISMPPPNETGKLSLGHAMYTLQDIMARYHRLKGEDVLWLPGTDHAALPVNALIEKQLAKEGTNKHEIGRDEFLRRTREFVAESRGTMIGQMRAMGFSADWSRLRYTLDETLNRCVNEAFVNMYNDGLIYRGHRIINWDPNLETTVSDDEVTYEEVQGSFYTFKYGPFEIGTARPETKFGDKYVVMHPDDERYAQYKHGDTFETEWINGPLTATIIKDEVVDPSFGTGVMTITPWHSVVDFDMAEKHGLDKEQIIDFHGKLLPIAGEFAGMEIAEARPKIVEKLKKKGLLVKEDKKYVHNIAVNERGKGVIEPQIKLQWFVDVNKEAVKWQGKTRSLKEVMQQVVRDGEVTILPNRFDKIYFGWIDNLRDWCISRQIWWGHRIPAWYRTDTDGRLETYVGLTPPTDQSEGWHEWEQDPDTLDTWFSSALWTWSTLIDQDLANENKDLSLKELLEQSPDFKAYHPTSVMETGWDLIFFWVARMILMTTYNTGQIPFKTVYLHGMVRAADGKKMSKSRPESIIDPLDVIEQYGTDALRMALIMGVSPGSDQNWRPEKVEANRNFCNKLWNIARYVEGKLDEVAASGEGGAADRAKLLGQIKNPKAETAADHWVLSVLQQNTAAISDDLDNYRFSEAYDKLYHFVWDDFADWYIEASKAAPNPGIMGHCLQAILQIAHPFAPFVTEAIWQTLGWDADKDGNVSLLATSHWPEVKAGDDNATSTFEQVKLAVSEIRDISRALQARKPTLYYSEGEDFFKDNAEILGKLANLDSVVAAPTDVSGGLHLTQTRHKAWLDIDSETVKSYVKDLQAKRQEQEAKLNGLRARMDNKSYVENAPKQVVEQTKQQIEEAELLLDKLVAEVDRFNKA